MKSFDQWSVRQRFSAFFIPFLALLFVLALIAAALKVPFLVWMVVAIVLCVVFAFVTTSKLMRRN